MKSITQKNRSTIREKKKIADPGFTNTQWHAFLVKETYSFMLRLHGLKLCLLCSQLHLLCFFLLPHQLKHLIHQRNKGKEKKEKTLVILLFNETKKKRRTWSRHATFLACGELLIFRNALAPRSRASGSNPCSSGPRIVVANPSHLGGWHIGRRRARRGGCLRWRGFPGGVGIEGGEIEGGAVSVSVLHCEGCRSDGGGQHNGPKRSH